MPTWFACAALALHVGSTVRAAERSDQAFVVHNYGLREGLPQASVTDVVHDASGRLWATTFGGISSFDGVEFERFDMAVEGVFPSNRFVSALAVEGGALWFGTEGAGLVKRRADGEFEAVPLPPPLHDRIVWDLAVDEDGAVWAAVELGIAKIDENGHVSVFLAPPEDQLGDLVSVAQTWRGLLVGSTHQLLVFDGRAFSPLTAQGEAFGATWGLGQDATGAIWGGGPSLVWRWGDAGVERWANASWNLRFAEGAGGVVWWPDGDRLMRYDPKLGMERTPPVEGMPLDTRALFQDVEGSLWVGSVDRGLFQLEPRRMERWAGPRGGGTSAVLPVAETRDGAIWTGGACGPLLRWGPQGAFDVPLEGHEDDARGEPVCLRELIVDGDGDLFAFGPHEIWRVRHDRAPLQGERIWSAPRTAPELRTAARSPSGALLVSRAGEELMVLVDDGAGAWRLRPFGGPELPRSRAGVSLAFGPDGALWAAGEGELVRVHEGVARRWTSADDLPPGPLRGLRVLGPDTAWVGSYGGGLGFVQGERVRRVTTRDGLVENVISAILPDEEGGLWLNGNRGISRVSAADVQHFVVSGVALLPARLYIEGEGNGGVNSAGLRARDGRLLLPGIDGLRVIHHEERPEHATPRAVIDSLRFGGVAQPLDGGPVVVTSGAGELEASFHARSFVGSRDRRFQYRLRGYEADWNEAGRARVARYTNLPPGSYQLELQMQSESGRWVDAEPSVAIVVAPAWHQRLGVRLGFGLLAGAAMALGWTTRTRALRERNQELQRELERRIAAERLAREREARYRSVFEQARNGFLIHEPSGAVVDANARATEVLGRSKAELSGGALLQFVAPEHRAAYLRLLEEVLKQGPAALDLTALRQSAGVLTPFYLYVEARPHGGQGERTVLVSLDDRTERAQREAEVHLLQRQAQQAQKLEAVGRLAGGVAHDFNNELTAILAQVATLTDALAGTPSLPVVQELEASALRAAEITRGLLTFSRGQVLSPRPTSLFARCQAMAPVLGRYSDGRADVRLSLEPPAAPVWVLADPTQLGQILVNLVINAFDAIIGVGRVVVRVGAAPLGRGSPALPVDVAPGGFGFLEVEDDGPGMSPEVQARAFEPFFTTKEVGRGTGLGLAQVHGIAKQSGGFVSLRTAPGEGCRVRVYLPAAAPPPGEVEPAAPPAPEPPVEAPLPAGPARAPEAPPAPAAGPRVSEGGPEADAIESVVLDAALLEQLAPRRRKGAPEAPPAAPAIGAPSTGAAAPPAPPAPSPLAPPAAGSGALSRSEGVHILVCDDNDAVLRAARIALRRAGFAVTAVSGPLEALSALTSGERSFDLLLTDVRMPDMDGTELARAVARFAPELPVLFMSGYSDVRVEQADQGWLLRKPFTPTELVERVHARLAAAP